MSIALLSAALAVVIGLGGWALAKVSHLGETVAAEQAKNSASLAATAEALARVSDSQERLAIENREQTKQLSDLAADIGKITVTLDDHDRRLVTGGL